MILVMALHTTCGVISGATSTVFKSFSVMTEQINISPVHAMKTYGESRFMAPLILNV
jgi:hypothetical protein